MSKLLELSYNYALFVAITSWFCAQLIKTIIHLFTYKKLRLERLFGAGGMPSAHSALVCSNAIAMSRITGFNSPEFAISFILAMIVMYDAMGVRRAAGTHAREINKIKKKFYRRLNDDEEEIYKLNDIEKKELKELLGHTPLEVLAGALLGILIAMVFPIR